MSVIAGFFASNMVLVFFVYGLAWFSMGFAVYLTMGKSVGLRLRKSLPYLAAFGLVHGIVEWLDMMLLAPDRTLSLSNNTWIPVVKVALLGLSAVLLLQFAVNLIADLKKGPRWIRLVPLLVLGLWMVSPFFPMSPWTSHQGQADTFIVTPTDRTFSSGVVSPPGQQLSVVTTTCQGCHRETPIAADKATPRRSEILAAYEIMARYLVYFPALLLSALGFYFQGREFQQLDMKGIRNDCWMAAASLAVTAFFGGLIVAPSPVPPSNWLNYHSFVTAVLIPPQAFRALCAFVSSFFIVRVLKVFEIHRSRQLEVAQRERLKAQEQLAQDLRAQAAQLADELAELHAFGERVGSAAEIERVYRNLTDICRRTLSADGCNVYFLSADRNELELAWTSGEKADQLGLRYPVRGELPAGAMRSGSVELMTDSGSCHLFESGSRQCPYASSLGVPLISHGEVIGVVCAGSYESNHFRRTGDVKLLQTIAGQTAVALHNSLLYAKVATQSMTDGLTGLYNHQYFHDRLDEELHQAASSDTSLSLLFCDLDFFKVFNDANGHQAGDAALKEVAQIMTQAKRRTDIAARYGGEEFALLLLDCSTPDAFSVAERIRELVANHVFAGANGSIANLTVSIGVVTFPQDASLKAELVDRADWSMYYAKHTGRNRVSVFALEREQIELAVPERSYHEELYLSTVYALAAAVDARDHYTRHHSEEVARYATAIARSMGLSGAETAQIRVTALLHDVGKLGTPDEILNKPDRLTEEEWAIIKEHPRLGVEILRHVRSLLPHLPAIRCHHEWYDGSGYPDGLKGDGIPSVARIISVADAYQAMTSDRPYRQALGRDAARRELRDKAGIQFDREVVEAFLEVLEREGEQMQEEGVCRPVGP